MEIPKKVHEVLDTYFDLVESKLPALLEAYYLYGSVSLGAFKEGVSDIDFIAFTKREVNEAEGNILKEIHRDMKRKYPNVSLDGMYVSSLNKNENSSMYFNDGNFQGFKKFDRNSIDAYQLKKYGITIKGQRECVDYTVNWDVLIDNLKQNLNTYWLDWVNDCKRFPTIKYIGLFVNLDMIEWGVLGVSRLYYTFKEKDITSKEGAGEYALRSVPQKWHNIINESMRLRKGIKKSYYKSVFKRRKDALEYMSFIIQESNKLL